MKMHPLDEPSSPARSTWVPGDSLEIDLTDTIRTRRQLARAAWIAYFFALSGLFFIPIGIVLALVTGSWSGVLLLLLPVLEFAWMAVLGRAVARGSRIAAVLLLLLVVSGSIYAVLYEIRHGARMWTPVSAEAAADGEEKVPVALMIPVLAGLCYLPARAVGAAFHYSGRPGLAGKTSGGKLRRSGRRSVLHHDRALQNVSLFVSGCLLWGLGLLVLLLGLLGGLAVNGLTFVGFAVFALLAYAGGRLLTDARRAAALRAAELRARDPRPPVLLLRSFLDDDTRIGRSVRLATIVDRRRYTLEELIADEMSQYGPVVAFGRPAEALPPLGAAREYAGEGEWQSRILGLLAEAALIVCIPGSSEGLLWEWERIIELGALPKVIFVFPPLHPETNGQRLRPLAETSGHPALAELCASPGLPRALACRFGADGLRFLVTSAYRYEAAYRLALATVSESRPAPRAAA